MLPTVKSYKDFRDMDEVTLRIYMEERRQAGMSNADVFREAGFTKSESQRARCLLSYRCSLSNCGAICWECAKACGGCSWSKSLTPVPGWEAKINTKTDFQEGITKDVPWYLVLKCPEFERERKSK